jgi:hypothetical protein
MADCIHEQVKRHGLWDKHTAKVPLAYEEHKNIPWKILNFRYQVKKLLGIHQLVPVLLYCAGTLVLLHVCIHVIYLVLVLEYSLCPKINATIIFRKNVIFEYQLSFCRGFQCSFTCWRGMHILFTRNSAQNLYI